MNAMLLKSGDKFKFEDRVYEVESNDGFMLNANNINPDDIHQSISWIGNNGNHDVEIVY